jgi:hypothetical protein
MNDYEILVEYEGLTIEEAKLTYAERKDLPTSAFCGPDRSYPAHDAKHVRNALARLVQAKGMSSAVKAKIMACLRRRAKKFGVEVSETVTTEESANSDAVIKWYLESLGIKS